MRSRKLRQVGGLIAALTLLTAFASGCGDSEANTGSQRDQNVTTTPSATPSATKVGKCRAAGANGNGAAEAASVTVGSIARDPRGPDTPANLNEEVMSLTSTADGAVDLSGWTVADVDGGSYTFPSGSTVCRYVVVSLHSGRGDNTDSDFYADWGWRWDDLGDTVRVRDAKGAPVVTCSYRGSSQALRCSR